MWISQCTEWWMSVHRFQVFSDGMQPRGKLGYLAEICANHPTWIGISGGLRVTEVFPIRPRLIPRKIAKILL